MSNANPLSQFVLAGRWQFRAQLGQGSDGAVYLAVDQETQQPVAIKVYHSLIGQDPETIRQTVAGEAAIARSVPSPYLVKAFHYGLAPAAGGHVTGYTVMEYLHGHSLGQHLERSKRIDLVEAVQILRFVIQAAGSLHEHGTVHLDLKPDNVFLLDTSKNEKLAPVKLLDYGAARSITAGRGPLRGTPFYAAPEVCSRAKQIGPPADLYSIGIMLYEMLVGKPPLQPGSAEHVVAQHVYGQLAPLPPPWSDHEVAAIYTRATDKDPAKRFASAREMLATMKQMRLFERIEGGVGSEKQAVRDTGFFGDQAKIQVDGGGALPQRSAFTAPTSEDSVLAVLPDDDDELAEAASAWSTVEGDASLDDNPAADLWGQGGNAPQEPVREKRGTDMTITGNDLFESFGPPVSAGGRSLTGDAMIGAGGAAHPMISAEFDATDDGQYRLTASGSFRRIEVTPDDPPELVPEFPPQDAPDAEPSALMDGMLEDSLSVDDSLPLDDPEVESFFSQEPAAVRPTEVDSNADSMLPLPPELSQPGVQSPALDSANASAVVVGTLLTGEAPTVDDSPPRASGTDDLFGPPIDDADESNFPFPPADDKVYDSLAVDEKDTTLGPNAGDDGIDIDIDIEVEVEDEGFSIDVDDDFDDALASPSTPHPKPAQTGSVAQTDKPTPGATPTSPETPAPKAGNDPLSALKPRSARRRNRRLSKAVPPKPAVDPKIAAKAAALRAKKAADTAEAEAEAEKKLPPPPPMPKVKK